MLTQTKTHAGIFIQIRAIPLLLVQPGYSARFRPSMNFDILHDLRPAKRVIGKMTDQASLKPMNARLHKLAALLSLLPLLALTQSVAHAQTINVDVIPLPAAYTTNVHTRYDIEIEN